MPDKVKPFTRREPPPTTRQVYALARELLDDTGRDWPGTRSECSELIARLRERNQAEGRATGPHGSAA